MQLGISLHIKKYKISNLSVTSRSWLKLAKSQHVIHAHLFLHFKNCFLKIPIKCVHSPNMFTALCSLNATANYCSCPLFSAHRRPVVGGGSLCHPLLLLPRTRLQERLPQTLGGAALAAVHRLQEEW